FDSRAGEYRAGFTTGGCGSGPHGAGGASENDGTRRQRISDTAALQPVFVRTVRLDRLALVGRGNLRRDGIHRHATHARTRHSTRARRASARRAETRVGPGHGGDRYWARARSRSVVWLNAFAAEFTVWRWRKRSTHVHGNHLGVAARRTDR